MSPGAVFMVFVFFCCLDGPNNSQLANSLFNDMNSMQQPQPTNQGMPMQMKWNQNMRSTPPPLGQVRNIMGYNFVNIKICLTLLKSVHSNFRTNIQSNSLMFRIQV